MSLSKMMSPSSATTTMNTQLCVPDDCKIPMRPKALPATGDIAGDYHLERIYDADPSLKKLVGKRVRGWIVEGRKPHTYTYVRVGYRRSNSASDTDPWNLDELTQFYDTKKRRHVWCYLLGASYYRASDTICLSAFRYVRNGAMPPLNTYEPPYYGEDADVMPQNMFNEWHMTIEAKHSPPSSSSSTKRQRDDSDTPDDSDDDDRITMIDVRRSAPSARAAPQTPPAVDIAAIAAMIDDSDDSDVIPEIVGSSILKIKAAAVEDAPKTKAVKDVPKTKAVKDAPKTKAAVEDAPKTEAVVASVATELYEIGTDEVATVLPHLKEFSTDVIIGNTSVFDQKLTKRMNVPIFGTRYSAAPADLVPPYDNVLLVDLNTTLRFLCPADVIETCTKRLQTIRQKAAVEPTQQPVSSKKRPASVAAISAPTTDAKNVDGETTAAPKKNATKAVAAAEAPKAAVAPKKEAPKTVPSASVQLRQKHGMVAAFFTPAVEVHSVNPVYVHQQDFLTHSELMRGSPHAKKTVLEYLAERCAALDKKFDDERGGRVGVLPTDLIQTAIEASGGLLSDHNARYARAMAAQWNNHLITGRAATLLVAQDPSLGIMHLYTSIHDFEERIRAESHDFYALHLPSLLSMRCMHASCAERIQSSVFRIDLHFEADADADAAIARINAAKGQNHERRTYLDVVAIAFGKSVDELVAEGTIEKLAPLYKDVDGAAQQSTLKVVVTKKAKISK